MTRPAPITPDRAINWPKPPSATPLWELHATPDTSRIFQLPGRSRPVELVADPFSS